MKKTEIFLFLGVALIVFTSHAHNIYLDNKEQAHVTSNK